MWDISWSQENSYQMIFQNANENAEAAFENGREEIENTLRFMKRMYGVVKEEGILVLEDYIYEIKGMSYETVLRDAMLLVVDGGELEPVMEYLVNDYLIREENPVTTWIFLIYICSMRCLGEYRKKRLREYHAKENPELLKEMEEEPKEDANIFFFWKEVIDIMPDHKIKV